jgi:Cft2 family RNA processing exonuclease
MIEYSHGIRVKGTELWLDALRKKPLCFVSHAHSDHVRRHETVVGTPETIELCRLRTGVKEAVALPYGEEREIGSAVIELFPSGHIHGAAQIMVRKDGSSVVYTGDFKMREGATARKAEVRSSEILIMEATYGRPEYVFPEREKVIGAICEFVRDTLYWGRTPVLFAYSLGKAQELIRILSERGVRLMVHESIYQIAMIYEKTGMPLGNYELFRGRVWLDHALLCPPQVRYGRALNAMKGKRTAFVTGWAMTGRGRSLGGFDEVFPLSDHADYRELLEYVRLANPAKVLVTHGFPEFVYSLRDMGYAADHLVPPEQGELL